MEEFDNTAGIHVIGSEIDRPGLRGNDMLREKLADIGINTVIIPGNAGAYDKVDQGIILARPISAGSDMQLGKLQEYPLGKGGIEIERTKVLLSTDIEEKIPVLNGPKLRALDTKWRQYELAKDYMPRTVRITASEQSLNLDDINTLQGKYLFVKADSSGGSRYVKKVVRNEVGNAVYGMRAEFAAEEKEKNKIIKNKDIIIQEDVPGLSMADELVAVDEASRQMLANATNTELRVYYYAINGGRLPENQRYYATARVFEGVHDKDWAYIDQGSVPLEAWNIADQIADELIKKANIPGGFFAVDLIKGDAYDGKGERILVREINVAKPSLVSKNDNYNDASEQNRLLANLISFMIKNGQTTK
jgi:hypothetical protein